MTLTFSIDGDGELLIKTGQKVNFNDPLTKKKSSQEVSVPLATILGIKPDKIFKTLKKFVGDEVKKGDLIAEHKTMLSKKHYTSEYDGVIKEINHNEGTLLIEAAGDEEGTVSSFFKGEIANIEGRDITIKIEKYKEFPLKEAEDDFGGAVAVLDPEHFPNISEEMVADKVVIAEKINPYDQVKLETLGSTGFIMLHEKSPDATVPHAVLEKPEQVKQIKTNDFPYCIISKKNTTIYFYA